MIFERGYFQDSQIGNYKDYLNRMFGDQAADLVTALCLDPRTRILDFGCATGGLVAALRARGLGSVVGTDISYWAIRHGRKSHGLASDVLQHYNRQLLEEDFDLVLFLDVLEHVPTDELGELLSFLVADRIVVRVPVSAGEGENFVLQVSRNDKTHVQVHDKGWWEDLFHRHRYVLDLVLQTPTIYDSAGVLSRVYRRG